MRFNYILYQSLSSLKWTKKSSVPILGQRAKILIPISLRAFLNHQPVKYTNFLVKTLKGFSIKSGTSFLPNVFPILKDMVLRFLWIFFLVANIISLKYFFVGKCSKRTCKQFYSTGPVWKWGRGGLFVKNSFLLKLKWRQTPKINQSECNFNFNVLRLCLVDCLSWKVTMCVNYLIQILFDTEINIFLYQFSK